MQQEWLAENPTGRPDFPPYEGYPLQAVGWRPIEDGDITVDPSGRPTFRRPDGAWWLPDDEVLTAHAPSNWYDAWTLRHRMYGGPAGEPLLRFEVSGEWDHDVVVPGAVDDSTLDRLLRWLADHRGVLHESPYGNVLVEDVFVENAQFSGTWIHCPSVEMFLAELEVDARTGSEPAAGVQRGDGAVGWWPHARADEVEGRECTVVSLVVGGRQERHLFLGSPDVGLPAGLSGKPMPIWQTGLSLPVALGAAEADADQPVEIGEVTALRPQRSDLAAVDGWKYGSWLHRSFAGWVDLVVELSAQSG